jgi:hypothetical protein
VESKEALLRDLGILLKSGDQSDVKDRGLSLEVIDAQTTTHTVCGRAGQQRNHRGCPTGAYPSGCSNPTEYRWGFGRFGDRNGIRVSSGSNDVRGPDGHEDGRDGDRGSARGHARDILRLAHIEGAPSGGMRKQRPMPVTGSSISLIANGC